MPQAFEGFYTGFYPTCKFRKSPCTGFLSALQVNVAGIC